MLSCVGWHRLAVPPAQSCAAILNLSTRQLGAFVLVARLGSFTRAAEQMHMTQAGMSATIRELEHQFACRLFDRTTRSIRLTAAGRSLLPFAERISNELRAATSAVNSTAADSRSILTVAATAIAATTLIAPAYRAFSERIPGVEVRIRDVPQTDIQRLVETGEADIGLTIFPRSATDIDALSLMSFRIVCIAPKGGLKLRRGRNGVELRWRDLPVRALITLPPTLLIQQVIDKHLTEHAMFSGQRTTYNSMHTILAMVQGGQGATILPSMILPACDLNLLDVAYLSYPVVELPFFRIARKGSRLPASAAGFVEALKSTVIAWQVGLKPSPD